MGEKQGSGSSGYSRDGNGADGPPAPEDTGDRGGGPLISVPAPTPTRTRRGRGSGRGSGGASSRQAPRGTHTCPDRGRTRRWGRGAPCTPAAPDGKGHMSTWGRHLGGRRRRAEPGSPRPPHPPARAAGPGLSPRSRRSGSSPPSCWAAETLTRSAGVAPSSPAALGRSRRRGGAGPAAPAGPPAPRGPARLRRRQLTPRERPGPRGHLPPAGRGRRTCGRPGSARSGRAAGQLSARRSPRAPAAAVPERARPPRIPSLGGAAPPSGRAGSGAGPGRAASAGRTLPRGLPRGLSRRCPRSPSPGPGLAGTPRAQGPHRQPKSARALLSARGKEQQICGHCLSLCS